MSDESMLNPEQLLPDHLERSDSLAIAISIFASIFLFAWFTWAPIWPESVSIIWCACSIVYFVGSVVSIHGGGNATLARKLLPIYVLVTWTFNWILAWAMIDSKLSMSTRACYTHPLSRIDSFYVSVTTLTTLGSGNFVPISQSCILTIGIQSSLDWVIVITIIAIFISRYFGTRPKYIGSGK